MDFKNAKFAGKGFNEGQVTALVKLEEFYNNPLKKVFTLSGAAGTGKTYILRFFIDYITRHSICVTAPTHKAVRVIENMTGKKGRTLQSLHGLRPNVNLDTFNIDNVKFDLLGEPQIKNYYLIIIDEASMINNHLYDLNLLRASQFSVKIVFVGDKFQLPPIKERISKCFTNNEGYELTEIVRQNKDNPLIKLLNIIRLDIQYSSNKFLDYLRNNKYDIVDGIGYEVVNETNFKLRIHDTFNDKEFEKNVDFVRFTSWTNSDIKKWNKFIRDDIIPDSSRLYVDDKDKQREHIICKDDLFTGYTTIVDEFFRPSIINSDDYIIDDIEMRKSDYGFKVYLTTLKSLGTLTTSVVNIVDHTDPTFSIYYNLLNNLHFNAMYTTAHEKGKRWREYYEFKNKYLSLIDFNLFTKGDSKVRGKVTKDLDYGYGLTTHKSQGSTYNNVFVNLKNMIYYEKDGKFTTICNTNYNPHAIEFRNKLAYVALSRASQKAIILL